VVIGYTFIICTYLIIGVFGYFAFQGSYFNDYFLERETLGLETVIAQDCLSMFSITSGLAFTLRLGFFFLMFFSYIFYNHMTLEFSK